MKSLPLLLAAASVLLVFLAPAAAAEQSEAINENISKLKEGIVETLATWIPFVVLFTLLGVAMSAIGVNLLRGREGRS